jgi:flagellar biosynthesis protein FlhA
MIFPARSPTSSAARRHGRRSPRSSASGRAARHAAHDHPARRSRSGLPCLALEAQRRQAAAAPPPAPEPENPANIEWDDVSEGAVLGLEIGYGLIGLVDDRKGAPLMGRITGIRKQLSKELGFVVPMVRVKDNLALEPNSYRITIGGVIVGEDEILPRGSARAR